MQGVSKADGNVFFQAGDGIRDLVRSRGLGDVKKRQIINFYEDQYLDLINFMLFLKTFPLPRH
ncbi:hypothetical protein [Klebsiella phage vB_KpnM-VAC66]|nr:hypothetical protein [Klebsiella phage vB_KpnM-VAC66]